jgi:hypothetical protein
MSPVLRRIALVTGAILALGVVAVGPVAAEPLVWERYEGSESGTWSDCGPTYEFEGTWSGLFTIKPGRGGNPTPYLTDNYEWDWVNRNPANGKWFTEHGNGQYKDVKITHLEGTIYRFVAQESGSPFTIVTSDGRKISVDRGLLRVQFDVDTKGDDDLENDEFIEGTDQLLGDHGSHAQWHRTQEEYCAIVNELLQ